MYLSRVKIHNFRFFRDFTLTANPNLNLIGGKDDSGKTALSNANRYALSTNSFESIRI